MKLAAVNVSQIVYSSGTINPSLIGLTSFVLPTFATHCPANTMTVSGTDALLMSSPV